MPTGISKALNTGNLLIRAALMGLNVQSTYLPDGNTFTGDIPLWIDQDAGAIAENQELGSTSNKDFFVNNTGNNAAKNFPIWGQIFGSPGSQQGNIRFSQIKLELVQRGAGTDYLLPRDISNIRDRCTLRIYQGQTYLDVPLSLILIQEQSVTQVLRQITATTTPLVGLSDSYYRGVYVLPCGGFASSIQTINAKIIANSAFPADLSVDVRFRLTLIGAAISKSGQDDAFFGSEATCGTPSASDSPLWEQKDARGVRARFALPEAWAAVKARAAMMANRRP